MLENRFSKIRKNTLMEDYFFCEETGPYKRVLKGNFIKLF